MKVKSESEVALSRLTLSDPMDHSLPGNFQARVLEWGAMPSPLALTDTAEQFFKWLNPFTIPQAV